MKKLFTICAALVAAMTMSAENMTCADAAAAALALGEGVTATDSVTVTGYVSVLKGDVSTKFETPQQQFYMDDTKGSNKETLLIYFANIPVEFRESLTSLNVGDKVSVTGQLCHYVKNGAATPELVNGNVIMLERNEVKIDTLDMTTCEVIAEAEELNAGDYLDDVIRVSGLVSAISSTSERQQTFDMTCDDNDKIFQAYNVAISEPVAIGDSVIVVGKVMNYNGKIEANGGKAYITKKGNVKIDTISVTVAEALAAAQKLENNAASKDVYAVTGYVDSISYAYSEQHDNISFFMCDDLANPVYEFQAYRAKGGKDLTVGAKVIVTGNLIHYYKAATEDKAELHSYQMNAGATIEIIGGTEGVENITIDNAATKRIENGQLVIIRNGVRYNAAGVVME